MKKTLTTLLFLVLFSMGGATQAQGLLGIGRSGIAGLPDTTHFGDTIRNMQVFVVNRGSTIVAGTIVQLQAAPNFLANPFLIGTLDLSLTALNPGDSVVVPLEDFVVSPQNSNNGSNIMVIWPTAPGTTPSDSAEQGYYVDEVAARSPSNSEPIEWILFPNPSDGEVQFMMRGALLPALELMFYDASGTEVYRCTPHQMQAIDLRGLSNGCYSCHLRSKEAVVARRKILICR